MYTNARLRNTLAAILTALGTAVSFAAAAPAAAAPSADSPYPDVVSIVESDGLVSITYYTPAPGVSVDALYKRLATAGTPGLVNPADAPTLLSPDPGGGSGCGNSGGANAFANRCPGNRFHWSGSHPAVYFLDHTGANWPVTTAVEVWNSSTVIDSWYRWYTQGCPNTSCVHVYNANYGNTGWTGLTTISYNPSTLEIANGVPVKLNDYYGYNSDGYRQNACHELGHALGLGHNQLFSSGSCMYYQIVNNGKVAPSSGDYQMLNEIY
jgi:hypothetical protein